MHGRRASSPVGSWSVEKLPKDHRDNYTLKLSLTSQFYRLWILGYDSKIPAISRQCGIWRSKCPNRKISQWNTE